MPRRLVYVGPTGRERFVIDRQWGDRLIGNRQFNLLRGDIERALYERIGWVVEVRFGVSVQSKKVERDGVGAWLSDGAEIGVDLVVGGDFTCPEPVRLMAVQSGAAAKSTRPGRAQCRR